MTEVLFDPQQGVTGLVGWITQFSGGLFFFMIMIVIMLISFFYIIRRWGTAWAVFSTGCGQFPISFLLWLLGGLTDVQFYISIFIFIISLMMFMVFKD